jgi:conjugal transfer pilus assembly protein TraD
MEPVSKLRALRRPPYEPAIVAAWFLGALFAFTMARTFRGEAAYLGLACLPMLYVAYVRGRDLWWSWETKTYLWASPPFHLSAAELLALQLSRGQLCVGSGFEWDQKHAAAYYSLSKLGKEEYEPPTFFLRHYERLGRVDPEPNRDTSHLLHGLGDQSTPQFVDYRTRETHTIILGTTGTGKTRTFEVMIPQVIALGHAVIVFDPKGDTALKHRLYAEATRAGKQSLFRVLDISNPRASMRLNPLHSYTAPTQVASRIAALLGRSAKSEPFTSFAWNALNTAAVAMIELGERPTLKSLNKNIIGDIDDLVARLAERHLDEVAQASPAHADWRVAVDTIARRLERSPDGVNPISARAHALAAQFAKVEADFPYPPLRAAIQVMLHDKTHYSKLIAGLLPLLAQLTAGEIGDLLSPDPLAVDDRYCEDMASLIDRGCIVYINLHSLADAFVGPSVGALLLADLTAVAAQRYSLPESERRPVSVFVDEAAEMINEPFIQALNKGRSAGYQLTIAMQTIADLVARLGADEKAVQVLGNTNNLFVLRVIDPDTQMFVKNRMREVLVPTQTESRSTSLFLPAGTAGGHGTHTVSEGFELQPLVSPSMLGSLAVGHAFLIPAGGHRVLKLRLPYLRLEDEALCPDGGTSYSPISWMPAPLLDEPVPAIPPSAAPALAPGSFRPTALWQEVLDNVLTLPDPFWEPARATAAVAP